MGVFGVCEALSNLAKSYLRKTTGVTTQTRNKTHTFLIAPCVNRGHVSWVIHMVSQWNSLLKDNKIMSVKLFGGFVVIFKRKN